MKATERNKLFVTIILIAFIFSSIMQKEAYADKYYGWIKKSAIDSFWENWKIFPFSTYMRGDYIYSEPNASEAFRIGYGEYLDPVLVIKEEAINGDKWLYSSYDEMLLLKNKELKSKIIGSGSKTFICIMGATIGALTIGMYLVENNKNTSRTNAYGGWDLGAIGAIIGYFISNYFVDKYNHSIIDDYNKNNRTDK